MVLYFYRREIRKVILYLLHKTQNFLIIFMIIICILKSGKTFVMTGFHESDANILTNAISELKKYVQFYGGNERRVMGTDGKDVVFFFFLISPSTILRPIDYSVYAGNMMMIRHCSKVENMRALINNGVQGSR